MVETRGVHVLSDQATGAIDSLTLKHLLTIWVTKTFSKVVMASSFICHKMFVFQGHYSNDFRGYCDKTHDRVTRRSFQKTQATQANKVRVPPSAYINSYNSDKLLHFRNTLSNNSHAADKHVTG